MWGIISSAFLGIYFLMSFYIARRGWSALKKSNKLVRYVYWFGLGILVLAFPITEIGQGFIPAINRIWISICGWYSMLAIVYIFFSILLIDIIQLLDRYVKIVPLSVKDNKRTPLIISGGILLLVFLILTYGTYNARSPVITRYQLSIDKKAESLSQLRIAMISDIHYGNIIELPDRLRLLVHPIGKVPLHGS